MKRTTVTRDDIDYPLTMPSAGKWSEVVEASGIYKVEAETLACYSALNDEKLQDAGRVHFWDRLKEAYAKHRGVARALEYAKLELIAGLTKKQADDLDLDVRAWLVTEVNAWLGGEVVGDWPPKVFDITAPASTAKRLQISAPEPTQASSSPPSSSGECSSSTTDGSDNPGTPNSSSPMMSSIPSP